MLIIISGDVHDRDNVDDGKLFTSFEMSDLKEALNLHGMFYTIGYAQVKYGHTLSVESLSDNSIISNLDIGAKTYLFLAEVLEPKLIWEHDVKEWLNNYRKSFDPPKITKDAVLNLREMGSDFEKVWAILDEGIPASKFLKYRTPKGKVLDF